jgi:hypothetical protein
MELTDAGGQGRPNWKLMRPARVRSSDLAIVVGASLVTLEVASANTRHLALSLPHANAFWIRRLSGQECPRQ